MRSKEFVEKVDEIWNLVRDEAIEKPRRSRRRDANRLPLSAAAAHRARLGGGRTAQHRRKPALPPLSNIAAAWVDLMRDGDLVDNGAASLYRGAAGLLLAVVVGGGLGMGMARFRLLDVFLNPLVELFYPLPKSALIPVTVLWLGFRRRLENSSHFSRLHDPRHHRRL